MRALSVARMISVLARRHLLLALLALALAALVAAGWYATRKSDAPTAPSRPAAAQLVAARDAAAVVEAPASESVPGAHVVVRGWAVHPQGIRGVEGRLGDRRYPARIGLARPDIAQAKPGYPDSERAGFALELDLTNDLPPPGVDRRLLRIVLVDGAGGETVIGTRSMISAGALTRWKRYAQGGPAFHLLPALSGIELGLAEGLDTFYADYVSPTTRIGTRVPILYLRTTKGPSSDYAFDPDWDIERRCKPGNDARRLSDDSLSGVFRQSMQKQLPVLYTLNGGVWGDAGCDMVAWDVNDWLEQDKENCQWSEKNEVVADDHLKNLAGAFESPELARALTFNVYATAVRRYKKRNLQQAASAIARFARERPDLFVGVTLEPDLYLNPFFAEQAWFDYNPGTLRQFREWLAGTGPYAGKPGAGVPDLSAYRRAKPLTLADVNRLAGRRYARWSEVDPPRVFRRDAEASFWNDKWTQEWEVFRRHLVDLHYDELSRWIVEAGIPSERVWSAQGFMAPHASAMPFAVRVDSPVKNYDSGGMSVEGSKPVAGHLGAILYGPSAQNSIRMEGSRSLFGAFAAIDPNWGVGEFNSADLRNPKELPTYAAAYRGLREMWNYGARYVSPMAWPGSRGRNAGKPGYDPFTAWRETPLEEAAKDFLLARANLPLGSKLWTFGAAGHADTDGWSAERGTIAAKPAHLVITPDASRTVTLLSPAELMIDPARAWRVVLLSEGAATPSKVRVWGRSAAGKVWQQVGQGTSEVIEIRSTKGKSLDQLRIDVVFRDGSPVLLTRVAIVAAPSAR